MRWHVAAAALMLALLVAAGVWYARPSSSATQDPVAIRNQIAQSAAVVVTFFVYGVPDATTPRSVLPDPPAMTFIRGEGWVWQAPAGPGDAQAGIVISSPARTLAAVAPGCYQAIPPRNAPAPWEAPGVNVMRNLTKGPGVTKAGDEYTYSLREADGRVAVVTEDLQGVGQNRSYSASISRPATSASGLPAATELFTVREATESERDRALALLDGARASAASTISLDLRILGDAPADGPFQTLNLVSLKDCPDNIAADYSKWSPSPPTTLDLFREVPPGYFLTAPVHISGTSVTLTHVVPVTGFTAPSQATLLASTTSDDAVRLQTGTMFAVLVHEPAPAVRNVALVYRVASCQASAWFPCGG
jgi:hypothetical protein